MVVAFSVGVAILLGVLRILRGWAIHPLIIGGYVLVTAMTAFAPDEIIGVAYDSGGVTTSTITVPLVTALGVGLATSIRGAQPDGRWLRAHRLCQPYPDDLRHGLRDDRMIFEFGLLDALLSTVLDVAPIAAILVVFQVAVLAAATPQPRPDGDRLRDGALRPGPFPRRPGKSPFPNRADYGAAAYRARDHRSAGTERRG